ncbi:MAG: RNA methyltransferase [Lachnospiraceae bacterium]|nr:RNA methyltransferase [Lachnospiraceae bacterium]
MISSTGNRKIKEIKELLAKPKARRESRCFVVEGPRMVSEIPGDRLEALYMSESFAKESGRTEYPDAEIVSDSVFNSISDTQTPQGILAVVRMQEEAGSIDADGAAPLCLFLENIQDPGNLGTILRTAECAGVSELVMSRGCTDIYSPKVIRSTMGAIFRVNFRIAQDLPETVREYSARGIRVYAAHLGGTKSCYDQVYTVPCGFIIGNEGNGLSEDAAASADELIRIPMEGKAESLNASVSAAVLLYEALRQRRG